MTKKLISSYLEYINVFFAGMYLFCLGCTILNPAFTTGSTATESSGGSGGPIIVSITDTSSSTSITSIFEILQDREIREGLMTAKQDDLNHLSKLSDNLVKWIYYTAGKVKLVGRLSRRRWVSGRGRTRALALLSEIEEGMRVLEMIKQKCQSFTDYCNTNEIDLQIGRV